MFFRGTKSAGSFTCTTPSEHPTLRIEQLKGKQQSVNISRKSSSDNDSNITTTNVISIDSPNSEPPMTPCHSIESPTIVPQATDTQYERVVSPEIGSSAIDSLCEIASASDSTATTNSAMEPHSESNTISGSTISTHAYNTQSFSPLKRAELSNPKGVTPPPTIIPQSKDTFNIITSSNIRIRDVTPAAVAPQLNPSVITQPRIPNVTSPISVPGSTYRPVPPLQGRPGISSPFINPTRMSISSGAISTLKPFYKCSFCCYVTYCNDQCKLHCYLHNSERSGIRGPLQCKICTHISGNKNAYIGHMVCHQSQTSVRIYSCDDCSDKNTPYVTNNVDMIENHRDSKHADISGGYRSLKLIIGPGKCPWCNWTASPGYEKLTAHIRDEHGEPEARAYMAELPVPKVSSNLPPVPRVSSNLPVENVSVTEQSTSTSISSTTNQTTEQPLVRTLGTDVTCRVDMPTNITDIGKQSFDNKSCQGFFECTHCKKTMYMRDIFVTHMKAHTKLFSLPLYQCNLCSWSSTVKKNIVSHYTCLHEKAAKKSTSHKEGQ